MVLTPFAAHQAHRGRATAVEVDRLLLLDNVWTAYVETADPASNHSDLEGLIHDMRAGLEAVREYATQIYPVFAEVEDSLVERAIEACLRPYPDGQSLLGFLRESCSILAPDRRASAPRRPQNAHRDGRRTRDPVCRQQPVIILSARRYLAEQSCLGGSELVRGQQPLLEHRAQLQELIS